MSNIRSGCEGDAPLQHRIGITTTLSIRSSKPEALADGSQFFQNCQARFVFLCSYSIRVYAISTLDNIQDIIGCFAMGSR